MKPGDRVTCTLCRRASAPLHDRGGRPYAEGGPLVADLEDGFRGVLHTTVEREDRIICGHCLARTEEVAMPAAAGKAGQDPNPDTKRRGQTGPAPQLGPAPRPASLVEFDKAAAEYHARTGRAAPENGASPDAWEHWTSWLKNRRAPQARTKPPRTPPAPAQGALF